MKYTNTSHPTGCEHDVLHVYASGDVTRDDVERLEELGFRYDSGTESWISYRFGSA